MKRKIYVICLTLIFLLIITGCNNTKKPNTQQSSNNSEVALRFLKDKGYDIVSYNGKVTEYVLKKEYLLKLSYLQYWGVQNIEASDYFNKTIETYKFIVKNHPLDNDKTNKDKQTVV